MKTKKLLSIIFIAFNLISVSAQKGNLRFGGDLGYCQPSGVGSGISYGGYLGYNITDNIAVSGRYYGAGMVKAITYADGSNAGTLAANNSYIGACQYFFFRPTSKFNPYVGIGAGAIQLGALTIGSNNASANLEWLAGGLLMAGFEWSSFRLGVEYNLIPDSNLYGTDGAYAGKLSNSYLSLTIGFNVDLNLNESLGSLFR